MERKQDRRFLRTRRMIMECFGKLLREKTFEQISVRDIAEGADINRSTFYLHFVDKFELFEEYMDEKLAPLYRDTGLIANESAEEKIQELLLEIFRNLQSEEEFYTAMFSDGNAPYFMPKLKTVIAGVILKDLERFAGAGPSAVLEFEIQVRMSALCGVIEWWVKNRFPLSAEKMSRQVAGGIQKSGRGQIHITGKQQQTAEQDGLLLFDKGRFNNAPRCWCGGFAPPPARRRGFAASSMWWAAPVPPASGCPRFAGRGAPCWH